MDHALGRKGSKEARPGYLVSLTLCVFCPYTEKIIFPGYCTEEKSVQCVAYREGCVATFLSDLYS